MSRSLLRSARARRAWGVDATQLAWRSLRSGERIDASDHGSAVQAALAAAGAGEVDVIAANELAVHWLQPPLSSARSLDEIRRVAAARCAHLFGGGVGDWRVAGDWSTGRAFVCAAVPSAVCEPLRRAAATRRVRLRWHSAWAVLCNARARDFPDYGWSGMRTPARVFLWHCTAGAVDAMVTIVVTPQMSPSDVAHRVELHLQLEHLSVDAPAQGAVRWADASADDGEAVAALRLAPLLEARS